jgi:hypothetical protein
MKLRDLFVQIGFNWDGAGLSQATLDVNSFKTAVSDIHFTAFVSKITAVRYAVNALRWALDGVIDVFATFLEASGQQERAVIAFEVMTGSIVTAEKTLKDLHLLATKTPFTVPDIEQNALMLNAMGFETNQLVDTMKILSDVVAGLPNTTIERLATNIGQVKAATYLTGKELRDFWRSGIPMAAELGKLEKFKGKGPGEIIDLISKRQVSSEDVMQVFKNLTAEGGRFHNMSIHMMETIPGMLSNFLDQIILLKREIGTGFQDTVKPVFKAVVEFFEENRASIKTYFIDVLSFAFTMIKEVFWTVYRAGRSIVRFIEYFIQIKTLLKTIFWTLAAFSTIKGLVLLYTTFVKIHAIAAALATTIPGLIGAIAAGIWTTLIPAMKAFVLTTLPMTLWGIAILGILLFIEDIFRFFSEGEDKVESVIGTFKNSGPQAKALVDLLEAAGKIIAGIVYLVMNWDPGLLKEGIAGAVKAIADFFELKDFDIDKIIVFWREVGNKIGSALKDPIVTALRAIKDAWKDTF